MSELAPLTSSSNTFGETFIFSLNKMDNNLDRISAGMGLQMGQPEVHSVKGS